MDKHSEYGRIYSEISKGYTIESIDKLKIYFKHPCLAEHFSTYGNYSLYTKEGAKKGLLLENEKIEEAINGGWWTLEKENKINFLRTVIDNLLKTRGKLIYPSQKAEIDRQIRYNESILITYIKERREIVGYTLEDYVNSKLTEELLICFTYKNVDFTERLFDTRDEYYDLPERQLDQIKTAFDIHSNMFNSDIIRKVALCGFFQNLVYLNDDAYSFWGKATVQCSKYQIDLLLYGKMYKNMIKGYSENGKPIPDEILNDPDQFISWIDSQSKSTNFQSKNKKSKSDGSNYITSPVGATSDDLNQMGIKVEKIKGKSLLQLAEEKGGTLEKSDYFQARENN